MTDFEQIIEFLRLYRRSEESAKNALPPTEVLLTPLDDGNAYNVNKNIFETDFNKYKRIFGILNSHNAEAIYLLKTGGNNKYYVKTLNGKYFNLLDETTETISDEWLIEFPIEFGTSSYIYDTVKNLVVIYSESLKAVTIFPDNIYYNPNGKYLKDLENDTYTYDYTDHVTTFGKIIKILFDDEQYLWNNPEKKVQVLKSEKEGRMTLIPFLQIEYGLKNFILKYRYYEKGYRPKFFLYDDECSIILKFTSIGGILTFLDQTLFSEGFSLKKGDNSNPQRDSFRDQFMNQVIHKIEDSIKSKSTLAYYDAMKTLFYLPESVAVMFNEDFLWKLMEMAVRRDSLTNKKDLAEENIFIKLIKIILQKEGQEVKLMNWFLETIKDGDKNISKFEFIYDRINGENFLEFAKLISQVWKKSRFIYPDTEKNPEFATTDGLLFLPYSSQKAFGFYFSNVSMSFETHQQKGRLIKTLYDTGKTEIEMRPGLKTDNLVPTQVPIIDQFWYHPFYPIYLKDIENQETEMKLDSVVPAFMLKANRDKQFWSNVITSAEYVADILTTVSGVGNIGKFRYLAKFAAKAEKLRFVSKAGRAVANVRKAVAATAAVVEITSGTVNTLLKLSGARDASWGKSLSEYLFWLELLSLSGELSVAIHNGLRKSAKEILEHEDEIIEEASKGKYNVDDLLDELYEIVEEKVRTLNIGDDLASIAEVDIKSVAKIADRIRKTTKLKNFDIHIVDRNNEELFDLFKAWQNEPRVEGVFIPRNGVYRRYGIKLKGPRIYLFTGNTSDGFMKIKAHTLQHEVFHVEMHAKLIEQLGLEKYQMLIDKIPTHIKEEYVVHRFLATKSKALDIKELDIELDNINNKYRKNANISEQLDKDYLAGEWNLKNELKKLNIHY
ncbi:hypothetical protein DDI74_14850 [Chryseobacterium gleum]|uniref:hypothetical protein n=1 Tax=Chryseobacterium gleum TaxID=250 RepID=UPI00103CD1B6|nr:hypothetical protein [Chryseobacterium gleum]QBJ87463.1 hypothetical protein DDI74_14850 [Chryseobacterium gleum]